MQNCGAKILICFVIDKFFELQFLSLLPITAFLMDRYTMEIFTATLSASHFIDTYRDAERIECLCRACPNYGHSWSCPPLDYDVEPRLRLYEHVTLVVMKVTPCGSSISWQELEPLLLPERMKMENRLRQLEREHNALSCYPGSCMYCNELLDESIYRSCCTRCVDEPCRKPHLARPSLEAYGFDLSRTMIDFFNLPLQWSSGNKIPDYHIYLAAIFHNSDSVQW